MSTAHPPAPAFDAAECQVLELRQYTLRPGRRDELIELFDREFVETQEATGMKVLGQFRDLDAPDRFVWLRGFADMEARLAGLKAFYGGPVWARHGPAANATMLEFDDVLLLQPAWPGASVRVQEPRPPAGASGSAPGFVDLLVLTLREPASSDLLNIARGPMSACLRDGGARQVAWFTSHPARNDFPRLPVREGLQVLAGLAVFEDRPAFDRFVASGRWHAEAAPLLAPWLAAPAQSLRLAPTARSGIRA